MPLTKATLPRDGNFIPFQEGIGRILGIPHVGNIFYVDPTNGSDTGNSGRRFNSAYKTVATAEDAMTEYNHDVVVVLPGGADGTAEIATITWDKNYCHLLGAAAPVDLSSRARMVTTTNSVDPCLTISANGCIFKNIQLATYQASNDVLVDLTGNRNYFGNVHFAGIGHATAGDDTSARDLAMTGAVENTFERCTFGLDTIARSVANASIEFKSSSSKNIFRNCMTQINADNTGALMVKSTGATGCSGWNRFHNHTWYAKWVNQADKILGAFDLSAQTQTAAMLMTGRQMLVGADDWEASASNLMWFERYTETTNVLGLGLNQA